MFDHLCYLDGVHVFVCWYMIKWWYFFVLIQHDRSMALSDVDVL